MSLCNHETIDTFLIKYLRKRTILSNAGSGKFLSKDDFFIDRFIMGYHPQISIACFKVLNKQLSAHIKKDSSLTLVFYNLFQRYIRYTNLRLDESINLERATLFSEEKIYQRPHPIKLTLYPLMKALLSQLVVLVLTLPIEILILCYVAVAGDVGDLFKKFINTCFILVNKLALYPDIYGALIGLMQIPAILNESLLENERITRDSPKEAVSARNINKLGKKFIAKYGIFSEEIDMIYNKPLKSIFLGTDTNTPSQELEDASANYALYLLRNVCNLANINTFNEIHTIFSTISTTGNLNEIIQTPALLIETQLLLTLAYHLAADHPLQNLLQEQQKKLLIIFTNPPLVNCQLTKAWDIKLETTNSTIGLFLQQQHYALKPEARQTRATLQLFSKCSGMLRFSSASTTINTIKQIADINPASMHPLKDGNKILSVV
jgi:hypothetical protein